MTRPSSNGRGAWLADVGAGGGDGSLDSPEVWHGPARRRQLLPPLRRADPVRGRSGAPPRPATSARSSGGAATCSPASSPSRRAGALSLRSRSYRRCSGGWAAAPPCRRGAPSRRTRRLSRGCRRGVGPGRSRGPTWYETRFRRSPGLRRRQGRGRRAGEIGTATDDDRRRRRSSSDAVPSFLIQSLASGTQTRRSDRAHSAREARFRVPSGCLRSVSDVKLAEDIRKVEFNRLLGHPELLGNLAVRAAFGDESEDLPFARSQPSRVRLRRSASDGPVLRRARAGRGNA